MRRKEKATVLCELSHNRSYNDQSLSKSIVAKPTHKRSGVSPKFELQSENIQPLRQPKVPHSSELANPARRKIFNPKLRESNNKLKMNMSIASIAQSRMTDIFKQQTNINRSKPKTFSTYKFDLMIPPAERMHTTIITNKKQQQKQQLVTIAKQELQIQSTQPNEPTSRFEMYSSIKVACKRKSIFGHKNIKLDINPKKHMNSVALLNIDKSNKKPMFVHPIKINKNDGLTLQDQDNLLSNFKRPEVQTEYGSVSFQNCCM